MLPYFLPIDLSRWKFPYENRLVEISQESYDILAYKWYPVTV